MKPFNANIDEYGCHRLKNRNEPIINTKPNFLFKTPVSSRGTINKKTKNNLITHMPQLASTACKASVVFLLRPLPALA
jgi:hypothetical protein